MNATDALEDVLNPSAQSFDPGEGQAIEAPAQPIDPSIRVLTQGGFVVLVIGGKGHRMLKRDARKLGGLLQKAGLK